MTYLKVHPVFPISTLVDFFFVLGLHILTWWCHPTSIPLHPPQCNRLSSQFLWGTPSRDYYSQHPIPWLSYPQSLKGRQPLRSCFPKKFPVPAIHHLQYSATRTSTFKFFSTSSLHSDKASCTLGRWSKRSYPERDSSAFRRGSLNLA